MNPRESIFIDDVLPNVEGAIINVGMQAFQFIDYSSCVQKLMALLREKDENLDDIITHQSIDNEITGR